MTPNIPPPSPTQASQVSDVVEEVNTNLPDPPPVHRVWEGKVWALEVVQQPIRARMCGFGDKVCNPFFSLYQQTCSLLMHCRIGVQFRRPLV